jgi:MFS family permease
MSHDPLLALRLPGFQSFALARFFLVIASQIQVAAVSWQMYLLTRDPLYLGLIGLVEAVCQISTALFGGYLADRTGPGRIVIGGFIVSFSCSMLLFASAQAGSVPLHLFMVVGLSGLARGFLGPAMFSLMTSLLPGVRYQENAATWNSANWQFAATAGPAVGGLLIGLVGPAWTYAADACIGILGIGFAVRAASLAPQFQPAERAGSLFAALTDGLRFVFSRQAMLAAMALDMFAVLFGGVVAVLPMFAVEILHAGPEALGFMRAAPAAGAAAMAVIIAFFPPGQHAGRVLLGAVAGFGLCMIAFAFSRDLVLSTAILALAGGLDNISVVIRSTILQRFTPQEMRGRVSAVSSIFIGSSNEIGAFESGVAARFLGLVNSVIFGGCMTLVTVGVTAVRAPALRTLKLSSQTTQ